MESQDKTPRGRRRHTHMQHARTTYPAPTLPRTHLTQDPPYPAPTMQRLPFEMTAAHAGSHNGRQVHLQTGLHAIRTSSCELRRPPNGYIRLAAAKDTCLGSTHAHARKLAKHKTSTQTRSTRRRARSNGAWQPCSAREGGGCTDGMKRWRWPISKGQQCWPSQRVKTNAHKVAGPGQRLRVRPTPGWLAACARHEWWRP